MSLPASILLVYLLLAVSVVIILTTPRPKKSNVGVICVFSLTAVYTIVIVLFVSLCTIHGCYNLNIPLDKAISGVCNTPQEDKLNNKPTSTLVYVYRFDCSDCTTLHTQIDNALAPYDHVCVSFENPQLTSFVKTNDVIYTPSVVAFNSQGDHMTQSIYTTDAQGDPVFNQHAFTELVKYMHS